MNTALTALELPQFIVAKEQAYTTEMLLSEEQIQDRVARLSENLAERYSAHGEVHVLTILNGAMHFASDLRRGMQRNSQDLTITSDQTRITSYAGTQSSGVLRFQGPMPQDLTDRHVLVVEDVLDTGLTLDQLIKFIKNQRPASLEVAVAVNKDNPDRRRDLLGDVVVHNGFEIDNDFVVGYGLDLDQQYRDLGGIYRLNPVQSE